MKSWLEKESRLFTQPKSTQSGILGTDAPEEKVSRIHEL
jgi:hypothetical protein